LFLFRPLLPARSSLLATLSLIFKLALYQKAGILWCVRYALPLRRYAWPARRRLAMRVGCKCWRTRQAPTSRQPPALLQQPLPRDLLPTCTVPAGPFTQVWSVGEGEVEGGVWSGL
jgi:hypothetical protein